MRLSKDWQTCEDFRPRNGQNLLSRNVLRQNTKVLKDYLSRSEQLSYGKHTPHLLTESLGWHSRYLRTGNMRPHEEN